MEESAAKKMGAVTTTLPTIPTLDLVRVGD
jgi:hypothetical protein